MPHTCADGISTASKGTHEHANVRHLRSHRGHSRHVDAAVAARPARSDQDGRSGGLRRLPPRRAPRVRSVHGTEPGGVHRGRLAGHQEHPAGADGEAVAAAPSGADHRGHGRRRQPHERPPRLRCRSRRGTHRALLVRQQLARVEGPLRRCARHHLRRVRDRRDQQRELEVLRLPDDPDVDQAGAAAHPVLVPRQPGHRGPSRHEPHVARAHRPGDTRRLRRDVARPQGRHAPRRRAELGAARRMHDGAGDRTDRGRGARHRASRDDRAARAVRTTCTSTITWC